MKAIVVLFVWLQVFTALGQTGPGGVGSTNGTSNLVFWLDANQITNLVSGSKVTSITDLSGYDHTATNQQSKPQFVKDVVNGNSVIRFDGLNSDLRGDLGDFDAPGTVIAFARFDQANQGEDDNDYIFSVGTTNTAGQNTSIARRKDEDGMGLNENLYYTWDGATVHNSSTTLAGSTWLAFTHILNITNTDTKYHQSFVDGSELSFSTDFPSALDSDGEFEIGDFRNAGGNEFKFDGDLAEIAIFDRKLNQAELNIIHSYFAGKYDHSTAIGSGTTYTDFYTGDDNGKGDHDLDVVGIGQHSSSETNDRAYSAGMTMSISAFDDGDYVMGGHALAENGINTSDIADTDAGATLEARWERVWYFDLTDSDNDVTANLIFNFSEAGLGGDAGGNSSNYKVLYRSGQSGSWDLLSTVPVYRTDSVIFTNVDIGSKGDGYYTIGTIDKTNSIVGIQDAEIGATGPGGIVDVSSSSDLELWLDATDITSSDGENIVRWLDTSGKSNDPTQSSAGKFPTYDNSTNTLNGHGVMDFDGSDDFLSGNLDANLSADATIVALVRFDLDDQGTGISNNDYVISIGDDATDNAHISISRRYDDAGGNKNKYYSFDAATLPSTGTPSLGPVITGKEWTLISGLHEVSVASSQRHSVYFEGDKQTDPAVDYSGDFTGITTEFNIGRWVGTTNALDGQIAELMVFSKALNIAELNIVHSYLSAKWAHSLDAGDKYAGDDLGNGGVCDGMVTCQPDYDLDVAGIGTASDGSNTSATSAGLHLAVSSGESATFTDGDYMMVGHNTVTNTDINTDLTTKSGDPIIETRSQRDWYLDVTETDASKMTVDLTFDFTEMGLTSFPLGDAANYRLMYRATNELDDEWTVVASASSISGDQLTFSNINSLDTDGFITLGSINYTESPLPVKLLEFNARAETDSVRLFWSTADETNNAFFAVQRSANGIDFEDVLFQTGYGNSQTLRRYELVDTDPLNGTSYYRLKQVDYNGNEEFSSIQRVTLQRSEVDLLTVYPNPAAHHLRIKGVKGRGTGTISLRNGRGMTVLSRILPPQKEIEMDISDLGEGMYLLVVNWPGEVETRKILVKR